jgi:galactose oxidase
VIDSISDMSPRVGGTLNATMSSDTTDAMTFSMIRMGSATHSINSDQRRVPVSATASGTTYTIQLPSDSGVLIPGSWYLFALNPAGVPSEAKTVRVDL